MTNNLPYYVGFSHCLGIGPMRFKYLVGKYGTLEAAYSAPRQALIQDFGLAIGDAFDRFRSRFDPHEKITELKRKGIYVLTREDPHFPLTLMHLEDPPICLYVKGDLGNYSFANDTLVAVVGTRKASSYGIYLAKMFASGLAAAGCVVVSGMAVGIDSKAHEATLDVGGRTIAFLGCGVDIVYPACNKELYRSIIDNRGLVISEFPPGMTVKKGLFVARNRLISGISKCVLVVEGTKDSGALITARDALSQGKEVYIPPVPLNTDLSQAPAQLFQDGAEVVMSPDHVLAKLNLDPLPLEDERMNYLHLNASERHVVETLSYVACNIDELTERLEVPIFEILETLSSLEVKGIVEKNKEGKYQVK